MSDNIDEMIAEKELPGLTGSEFMQIREACNFTRLQCGDYLSYDQSTVFKWEKYNNRINDDAIDVILPRLIRRLEQVMKNVRYWHNILLTIQIDRKKARR